MRFKRPSGGVIEIGEMATLVMSGYRQISSRAPEAGGILLGRLIVNTRDVVVDQVSIPRKEDKKWRFFFSRKKEPAQRIVETVWTDSQAVMNYLGEWHTHPEDIPTPSSFDLSEWLRICQMTKCDQDFLLFVIIGKVKTLAWEASRNSLKIAALQLID